MPFHLTELYLRDRLQVIMVPLRTFHNQLYIADKTMNDTQCLRNGHPRLVLGQSIQSLKNCFDLALPQQLLRKLLCGRL